MFNGKACWKNTWRTSVKTIGQNFSVATQKSFTNLRSLTINGQALYHVLKTTLNYSPQISSSPFNHRLTRSVVTDFGLSSGKFRARSQQRLASTPKARL